MGVCVSGDQLVPHIFPTSRSSDTCRRDNCIMFGTSYFYEYGIPQAAVISNEEGVSDVRSKIQATFQSRSRNSQHKRKSHSQSNDPKSSLILPPIQRAQVVKKGFCLPRVEKLP